MLIAAASCSGGRVQWSNPALSESEQKAQKNQCYRLATEEVEKEMLAAGPDAGEAFGRGRTTLQTNMERYEAERRRQRLFERCMTAAGYRRVTSRKQGSGQPAR